MLWDSLPTVTWTELWKAGLISHVLNLYHAVVPLMATWFSVPAHPHAVWKYRLTGDAV